MKNLIATISALTLMASVPVLAQDKQPVDILNDWSYDTLYASGISVDQMLNATVYGPSGDEIGSVKNVIFSDSGKALAMIAQVGGFWDIGDTHVSVPWADVVIGFDEGTITIPVTEDNAADYPIYGDNGWFSEQTYFARDADQTQAVNDNLAAGPNVFRASEFIGDYAYLNTDTPYGYVSDLIVENGQLSAMVMDSSRYNNRPGYYAYPYYTRVGSTWNPYDRRYQMPYDNAAVDQVKAFDYDKMTNSIGFAVAGPFEDGRAAYERGDYSEAVKHYRIAAERGDARAQNSLGSAYTNGEGVPRNFVFAHMWFNLAAAQGYANAVESRLRVTDYMYGDQIAKAQRMAREWKPGQ